MFRKTFIVLALIALATPSASAAEPEYKLAVTASRMKVGVPGTIAVRMDVLGNYKWNVEYPAKIALSGMPATLTVPKANLAQLAGDFKVADPKVVVVDVPAIATAALKAPVTVDLAFSICNDRLCLVKKEKVVVEVAASL